MEGSRARPGEERFEEEDPPADHNYPERIRTAALMYMYICTPDFTMRVQCGCVVMIMYPLYRGQQYSTGHVIRARVY